MYNIDILKQRDGNELPFTNTDDYLLFKRNLKTVFCLIDLLL